MTDVLELITRRRKQILVHSFLYYELNDNVIQDSTFDDWSKELAVLQVENPIEAEKAPYSKEFKGFDGSSGYHLNFYQDKIKIDAYLVLSHRRKKT